MRSLGFVALFLLLPGHVLGQEAEPVIALKSNHPQQLASQAASRLGSNVVDLLKTSNFNSKDHAGPVFPGGTRGVHGKYRETVGARYLVVTFPQSRQLELIRGHVTVIEIVVGLNNPKYADALFTIDPDGRVVEHSKYSGELATDLLRLVTKLEDGGFERHDVRPVGRNYFECHGLLLDADGHKVGIWGVNGK